MKIEKVYQRYRTWQNLLVWCVRVGHSSCAQYAKNVHPLVLSVFFLTADRMQNPE